MDYRIFSVEISESCLAIDTWIGNESDLKEHSSYVSAKKQFKAYANIELPTMYCVRADTSFIDAFDESSESYTISLIGGSNLNGETYQKFEDLFISTIGECDKDYPKEETKLKISKWSKFGMSIILKHSLDNHHIAIEAIDDAKDQSKNMYRVPHRCNRCSHNPMKVRHLRLRFYNRKCLRFLSFQFYSHSQWSRI